MGCHCTPAISRGEQLTALEAADRALALGPRHGPALLMRALMVRDVHGASDSLPWFKAAIAADPENADALAEYAATLGDGGQAQAMLEAVRALAEAAPDDPRVFYLQAVLAARGGEFALARSLLARSGMAARGIPAAMQLDAVINLAEGNADSAATTLETLVARQPANARLRDLLARALFDAGRPQAVVQKFAEQAQLPEASPYLVMLVARAHERLGDRAEAAPLLVRAYGGSTGAPVVLALRENLPAPSATARAAGLAGNWSAAWSGVDALTARFPASADVAVLTGDVALADGDPRGALEAYARAALVKRPWPLARKAAWAYVQAGDPEAAKVLLARHVAGEPDAASALVALARRQAEGGAWSRAALLLDHAIAREAGHDPSLLALRLRAARETGDKAGERRFAAMLAEVQPRPLTVR
ncbi:hypothetical protein CHX26_10310 [Porphyrobacter sp. HT-58-2]|uniref:tetratricopeptide repeat protein n=1 Tax=Porphyrobacter sp. HT-58-2 TaxID=2023229 RepID=UPI000CDCDDF3|nr:tetratricopeptide repeat protein [Porphyrobacter sp. HT-58-2]AUX69830.1 hypothetical protein CHX26_10310 [Porphyrobacter sp. HT-58-2]